MISTIAHRNKSRLVGRFASAAKPQQVRTHQEFAEQEIYVTTGPYAGGYFRCEYQPWSRLLFEELDRGWPRVVVTAPSQAGKTLYAVVVPVLRTASELASNSILGVPEADMAADKWTDDVLPPMIESPRLMYLIPRSGSGSKGGTVRDVIHLGNGRKIKIMSRGSQDSGKAGYTSQYVYVTEAQAWSIQTGNSAEANPFKQLEARQRAFKRDERRVIIEGTVTDEFSLPWSMKSAADDDVCLSTESRIICPCPHCGEWVTPERSDLIGWQHAKSEREAQDCGAYACPECGELYTEEQRIKANRASQLIHRGQTVEKNHGDIVGDLPPTSTLWFRSNAFNNLFSPQCDLAVDEWMAAQLDPDSEDIDDEEKRMSQFVHALPYVPKSFSDSRLSKAEVLARRSLWPENSLPEDTQYLVAGIDPGGSAKTAHYKFIACRSCRMMHVPTYGPFDVDVGMPVEIAILEALRRLRDQLILPGVGGKAFDRVGVDMGWMTDVVIAFCRESNDLIGSEVFLPTRGRGTSVVEGRYRQPKRRSTSVTLLSDARYYLERGGEKRTTECTYDADRWKTYYQRRYKPVIELDEGGKPTGPAGALTLFASPDKKRHDTNATHLTNERMEQQRKPGRPIQQVFVCRGANHLLDCGAIASVMAHLAGFRISESSETSQPLLQWGRSRGKRRDNSRRGESRRRRW